jgi:protein O-mannosyl-transferase
VIGTKPVFGYSGAFLKRSIGPIAHCTLPVHRLFLRTMPGNSVPQRTVVRFLAALCLSLGLSLACYGPSLRGQLLWDDDAHVTPTELQGSQGLVRIWTDLHATQQYYPALYSAFWVEHRLWGSSTLGYHLANVMQHALSAALIVLLLERLCVPGAWIAGLLFAIHPVCTESVAWIAEQKNTLSLVFYLLAAHAYLVFEERRGSRPAIAAYLTATLFFVLALLSKSVTATLPAALLVLAWWRRGRLAVRDAVPLAPWFAASFTSGILTALVEKTLVGARGPDFAMSIGEHCLLASRILWFYLGKTVWPSSLAFFYAHWNVPRESGSWIPYLAACLALTAALALLARRVRGPLAAWLLFAGALFPALGFFDVYPFVFSYVADHFQYLALPPAFALAAAGAAMAWRRLPRAARPILALAGIAAGATLVGESRSLSRLYTDPVTHYEGILRRTPDSWLAHNNLGLCYAARGDTAAALAHYQEALRLYPAYAKAHDNLGSLLAFMPGRINEAVAHGEQAVRLEPGNAKAHYNLGISLALQPGRLEAAIGEFRTAIRLLPNSAEAHNNLGNALSLEPGRMPEAIREFHEAIRLKPNYAEAHVNLGNALLAEPGSLNDAISEFREAVRIRHGDAQAHLGLAEALSHSGPPDARALDEYREAIRLRPDGLQARLGLAQLLGSMPGHQAEAVEAYAEALKLEPDSVEIRVDLGHALRVVGRVDEAVACYEEAIRRHPDYAPSHFNLANALVRMDGRLEEAIGHYQEAVRLKPDQAAYRSALDYALGLRTPAP